MDFSLINKQILIYMLFISSSVTAQMRTIQYTASELELRACQQFSFAPAIDWTCSHTIRFTPTTKTLIAESVLKEKNQQMMHLLEQADDYLADEDYAQAELAYRQAIKLRPKSSLVRIKLGYFYTELDRDADALQSLQYGLEAIPNNADIIHEMGLIQVRLRLLSKAIVSLAKAAILAPENPHYSYVYGIAMNSYQRPEEALDILQQALLRHPIDRPILNALVAINQDNNHFLEAISYAEQLLVLEPENPDYQALTQHLKILINSDKK
ncbi:tetratricopeptide repeat protein [sulfur-oxidizing endosymbiont of Gigantopelta aegis]|uniref:tetratricopeptide repeat protein n=1 Tax=sulfur-oxidizing endosymbiont of Gigantopelta aegis TaxID=2794934 RepID=UPI0018DDDCD3|nr:tetratricopeptide repeat protein [sulfur-oxidizing endosymbiont of Gigantopelta aegis]